MYCTNITFVLYGCYATFDSSFEPGMLQEKFSTFILYYFIFRYQSQT